MHKWLIQFPAIMLATAFIALAQDPAAPDRTKETEGGIPVTDHLTVEKCSGCHKADSFGNLSRISWIRTTPEGWQESIKRMIELNGVHVTPEEAHQIVRYLSNDHGLAPEETQPVRWYLTLTQPQTEEIPSPVIRQACATCHAFARPLTWRRSAAEWQLLKNMHIGYFPLSQFVAFSQHAPPSADPNAPKPKQPADEALDYLTKNDGLYSAAWSNWRAQMTDPDLSGVWLLTASSPGKGKYFGEMSIARTGPGEFKTQTTLTSAQDGSKLELPGKSFIYTGYEWRGSATGKPIGSLRQVMTVSPDGAKLEGRWFWGAYQEFGFTVSGQRETQQMTVLGASATSLRAGSSDVPLKIFGQHFPSDLKAADVKLGPGVTVSKIVSVAPTTVTVSAAVAPQVMPGARSIAVRGKTVNQAFTVYDTVDYIKISAETALAHVGGTVAQKGYVQYEAHAFAKGFDGLPNTADDVDLGPIDVKWSLEEFISHNHDNDKEFVGYIDGKGLFTPGGDGPNPQRRLSMDNIGDVWVVAKYPSTQASAPPLEAKSYLVVAIPDFLRFDSPEVAGK